MMKQTLIAIFIASSFSAGAVTLPVTLSSSANQNITNNLWGAAYLDAKNGVTNPIAYNVPTPVAPTPVAQQTPMKIPPQIIPTVQQKTPVLQATPTAVPPVPAALANPQTPPAPAVPTPVAQQTPMKVPPKLPQAVPTPLPLTAVVNAKATPAPQPSVVGQFVGSTQTIQAYPTTTVLPEPATSYAQTQYQAAQAVIMANRQAIQDTNQKVADNTARLAAQDQRMNSLEQSTNRRFGDLKSQVDDNKRDADGGIAGVAAIASIPQVTDHQQFSVGAGVGAHGNEQALAVGFSARVSDHWVTKAAVSTDTYSGLTAGAGASYGW